MPDTPPTSAASLNDDDDVQGSAPKPDSVSSAARTTPGYCAWWSEKPDDRDIILIQVRANASMTTLPSHIEVRPAYSGGHLGWGAFIERDVPCRHCGALAEEDGDHSCPCPYRDEECPDHA